MEMVQTHRWTRREYERMGEAGVFHPEAKTELIDGEIVEMSPQGSHHFTAIRKVEEVLRDVFRIGYDVRVQGPLGLSDLDEPEPDVAVVTGHFTDYAKAHPTKAVLVVEISNSTLVFDRGPKLALYARAGVPEYWIVNLVDRCVEVYREPVGEVYRSKRTSGPEEQISPAGRPEAAISVETLLP